MLNVEKYLNAIKEELTKDACASKSCLVAKVRGGGRKPDCDNRLCRDCEEASLDWLFEEAKEYTEIEVMNGDSLTPGQDVLAFSYEGGRWYTMKFLFYNNAYYCVSPFGGEIKKFDRCKVMKEV